MNYRRDADKTLYGKVKNGILRIRTELTLALLCGLMLNFLPQQAVLGVVSLFITKVLFISIGILIAHASRKFMFPYLDMQKALEGGEWGSILFITVWYGVIVFACATGG